MFYPPSGSLTISIQNARNFLNLTLNFMMRHLKNWYAQRNNIDQRKETARKLDPNEMAQQQAEPKDCDRT
jgi:hypothetical protein